jgi:hypothetical protein
MRSRSAHLLVVGVIAGVALFLVGALFLPAPLWCRFAPACLRLWAAPLALAALVAALGLLVLRAGTRRDSAAAQGIGAALVAVALYVYVLGIAMGVGDAAACNR